MFFEGVNSGGKLSRSEIIQETVSVHYNKFNTNGLKPVVAYFKRNGYEVDSFDVDEKVRKKDGMPTKKVKFTFKNGQSLLIVFAFDGKNINKAMGFAFEAKVDNKKVPIKQSKSKSPQTAKTLEKLISYLKKSEPAASKRKKILVSKEELKTSPNKKVIQTMAAKMKAANERKLDLSTALTTATQELENAEAINKELNKANGSLKTKLEEIKSESNDLENELETLNAA